jgi:hypothetical protein
MFAHNQPFAKEDKVELTALGGLGEAHIGRKLIVLSMIWVTPGDSMPDALEKCANMQLSLLAHISSPSK